MLKNKKDYIKQYKRAFLLEYNNFKSKFYCNENSEIMLRLLFINLCSAVHIGSHENQSILSLIENFELNLLKRGLNKIKKKMKITKEVYNEIDSVLSKKLRKNLFYDIFA